ncbi:hypothetical protein BD311DRAFT_756852 [Dichomitus squalens]|uniref:Secreted protein n=1 Tax=Dichomitus squalens TaxID=114155 RepID=A0A4Q9MNI4_9APHY|nr:hypothetical protein BD311DRAFT_756852 [Dichomitus squalens]
MGQLLCLLMLRSTISANDLASTPPVHKATIIPIGAGSECLSTSTASNMTNEIPYFMQTRYMQDSRRRQDNARARAICSHVHTCANAWAWRPSPGIHVEDGNGWGPHPPNSTNCAFLGQQDGRRYPM